MSKLKVAIDLTVLDYNREGIGNFVEKLYNNFRALNSEKIELIPIVYAGQDVSKLGKFLERIEVVRSTGPLAGFRSAWNITRAVSKQQEVTAILSTHTHLLSLFKKNKIYWLIHDISPLIHPEYFPVNRNSSRNFFFKLTYSLAIRRTDLLLATTEFVKAELERYFPRTQGKTVILGAGPGEVAETEIVGVDQETVLARYGLSKQNYFLYLGTLNPRKGLTTLIAAYKQYLDSQQAVRTDKKDFAYPRLVLAGRKGWLYQEILDSVKNFGLTDKVVFTDYVENPIARILLENSTALINPSRYEGLGMPPLEAILLGKEVILSDIPVFKQLFGKIGHFFEVDNSQELAAKMKEVRAVSPKVTAEVSSEFSQRYNWQAVAKNLEKTLI